MSIFHIQLSKENELPGLLSLRQLPILDRTYSLSQADSEAEALTYVLSLLVIASPYNLTTHQVSLDVMPTTYLRLVDGKASHLCQVADQERLTLMSRPKIAHGMSDRAITMSCLDGLTTLL